VIRFRSIGSGSGGNATVVEASSGITTTRSCWSTPASRSKELDARLARAGLAASDLDAVFVTHEHGDHIGCALALAEREQLPLWMSRGTWRATGGFGAPATLRFARDAEPIAIGDIEVHPFTVAHDAAEPLQLRCGDGEARLVVLTDLGSITAHMIEQRRRLRRDRPRVQSRRRDAGDLALSAVAQGADRRAASATSSNATAPRSWRAAPAPGCSTSSPPI
jgi:phosphoribosyl 1,2-cyclic phosphodiesterase